MELFVFTMATIVITTLRSASAAMAKSQGKIFNMGHHEPAHRRLAFFCLMFWILLSLSAIIFGTVVFFLEKQDQIKVTVLIFGVCNAFFECLINLFWVWQNTEDVAEANLHISVLVFVANVILACVALHGEGGQNSDNSYAYIQFLITFSELFLQVFDDKIQLWSQPFQNWLHTCMTELNMYMKTCLHTGLHTQEDARDGDHTSAMDVSHTGHRQETDLTESPRCTEEISCA